METQVKESALQVRLLSESLQFVKENTLTAVDGSNAEYVAVAKEFLPVILAIAATSHLNRNTRDVILQEKIDEFYSTPIFIQYKSKYGWVEN